MLFIVWVCRARAYRFTRFTNLLKEYLMNKDTIEGNWMQFKGKVKEQWGKLTDDDLDVIAFKNATA